MKTALESIKTRFEQELEKLPIDTAAILFILSDGEPTDGNPSPVALALKSQGIHIISCFVTDQDIIESRRLFETQNSQWTDGAKLMFELASSIKSDSVFIRFLSELKWQTQIQPKLFSQVNHSESLDEFVKIVLCPFIKAT